MSDCADFSSSSLARLKQDVFAKLAFLGMPHGDVAALRHLWKVVNLSVRLGKDGAEKLTTHPEVPKLVKALSKDLGAPRADLFVKWLIEKVTAFVANPVDEGDVVDASKAADSAAASLNHEGRYQPSESSSAGKAQSSSVEKEPAAKLVTTSADANQDTWDEAWVELKSKEGRKYYWDRRSNACSWSLPEGVRANWVSHKSSDGRTYYADHEGKSFWVMSALPVAKSPREKAERKLQEYQQSVDIKSAAGCSEQFSQDCRFLPEVGVLKPLVLPPPPAVPSATYDDLGPFEAALEPETPVLPEALVELYQPIAPAQPESMPDEPTTESVVEAVPKRILMTGASGSNSDVINGTYDLQAETYEGKPQWRKDGDADYWLLSFQGSTRWYVSDSSRDRGGWAESEEGFASPSPVMSWQEWDGSQWVSSSISAETEATERTQITEEIMVPVKQSEICDTSKPEKDLHVASLVKHSEDEFAIPTGLREEVLLLKKQLAELREKQSEVALQAECKPEPIDTQKAEAAMVVHAASTSSSQSDDKQSAHDAKKDAEGISAASASDNRPLKKRRQAAKEAEITLEAHATSIDAPSEKDCTQAIVELSKEERPLMRRKAVAHKSGRTSSEEETKPASTSEEDDEWDSWSKALDMLSGMQLPEKLDEEQQKITDAYLSSFDTSLTDPSASESEEDASAKKNKGVVISSVGHGARKKPRNAINFWACPKPDVQLDADSGAPSSSAPSQPKVRDSRKRGRADSRTRECHSETKEAPPSQDDATINSDTPCGEKAMDRFLTVVKYGAPPGNWGATPKSVEESGKATVFEFRQSRRTSLGGA